MNLLKTVKISVIVPIYGIEKYLSECIVSLLNQSFEGFELILVDDGSLDNCPQICDDYAKLDARIKVVHKKNGGLLSARKAGLKVATAPYIAFVDGDDWVDPYYLDILYKMMEANSSDLVVSGHFREFDGKIETIVPKNTGFFGKQEIKSLILPNAIYNGRFCEHGVSTYVWNKLFKRTLLAKILYDVPNDIIMGEDAAITYTYLSISENIVITSIPLYYYRQRHDSIVKSIENPKTEYFRLGLLVHFLKSKLQGILEEKNLKQQLTYYLYSQILVRSGGLIFNENGILIHNPFLMVQPKSKVIVYSSGSFGQHILSTNKKNKYFEVVNWIDIDYHELEIGGNFVKPFSSFDETPFDHLIIATINPSYHDWILNELRLMGMDEEKIVVINTNLNEINKLLIELGFDTDYRFYIN